METGSRIVKLYRHLQSGEFHGKELIFKFRDEFGKLTVAKYRLVEILKSNIEDLNNYVWRLDGRSVRYMKRTKIIENLQRRAKKWKH